MLTVAVELSKALVERRGEDEIVLLCSRDRPPSLEGLDCEAVLSPYRHELVLKTRWLPTVEPLVGCDAILYPYWPSPPFRHRDAPPAAIFVHDLAFKVRPAEVPWQQRAYLGAMLPRALRLAAAVLAPSESTRRDLLRFYALPGLSDKVEVVPEGLPSQVPPGPLPGALAPGFILAVGTVEPRKNYSRLLQAYRLLRSRGGAPPLVVAGRVGWSYGDTLEMIKAEPGVRYLGHVDEPTLSALYGSAAVLAFPSLYEGFGLPLLEAMARGLPAIVGSAGALPELAQGAALSVDAGDAAAIAGGLEELLGDPALRSRLGEAGRRRAATFTWALAADHTLAVLRRIADAAQRKVA
jgi:glycosyltransferase involved in cell wall biosynthesis